MPSGVSLRDNDPTTPLHTQLLLQLAVDLHHHQRLLRSLFLRLLFLRRSSNRSAAGNRHVDLLRHLFLFLLFLFLLLLPARLLRRRQVRRRTPRRGRRLHRARRRCGEVRRLARHVRQLRLQTRQRRRHRRRVECLVHDQVRHRRRRRLGNLVVRKLRATIRERGDVHLTSKNASNGSDVCAAFSSFFTSAGMRPSNYPHRGLTRIPGSPPPTRRDDRCGPRWESRPRADSR